MATLNQQPPKIDLTKLNGEGLLYYYEHDCPDKDYASCVRLVSYATMDLQKAFDLLERSIKENKKFVAFYPEFEDYDTSKMEYIGEIIDGALYLK